MYYNNRFCIFKYKLNKFSPMVKMQTCKMHIMTTSEQKKFVLFFFLLQIPVKVYLYMQSESAGR